MADQKAKPVHKVKCGSVTASTWENVIDHEGKKLTVYNTTVEKHYKKGEEWKTTNSYNDREMADLFNVVQAAMKRRVIEEKN